MIADAPQVARLTHTHRVTTHARGRPLELFVFDHHRTAFSLWALAAKALGGPLRLVSLDRHFDLELPQTPPPDVARPIEEIDDYARLCLSPKNDDHILAAMESGAISDGALFARSHVPAHTPFPGGFTPYLDARGREHHCHFARSPDELPPTLLEWLSRKGPVALDLDLDCFTTLSDAHPDEVLIWDEELIDAFLCPPGSRPFWDAVIERTALITLAREPYHCGGLGRGARLWLAFSEVFFRGVLGVPPP